MKVATFSLSPGSLMHHEILYPAGELQVRLDGDGIDMILGNPDIVNIISRVTSSHDIMRLALLKDAIDNTATKFLPVNLVLPYLPYGRADRSFCIGDCNGLEVFSSILRLMGFNRVVSLDIHSVAGIKAARNLGLDLENVSPLPIIHSAIGHFAEKYKADCVTILFPDAGARERYVLPEYIGNNHHQIKIDVQHCEKRRDPVTGKLSGFIVPDAGNLNKNVLIIDDICDGGGTFVGIADAVYDKCSMEGQEINFGLYVTHGIFSKGLGELNLRFKEIYTSDSWAYNYSPKDCMILPATNLLLKALIKDDQTTAAVRTV